MCGIIGIVSHKNIIPDLLDALKRLEYRGYDSAGIATLEDKKIRRIRSKGKLINLEKKYQKNPLEGMIGIGHTRWATHGEPNELNAHPHITDKVALVHNGIIENYDILRQELEEKGCVFQSETDTEVIAHLLTYFLNEANSLTQAAHKTLQKLHGAFAIAAIFKNNPNIIFCARKGSPLAIGKGDKEIFIGSDAIALAPFSKEIIYLEENDWALITIDKLEFFNEHGEIIEKEFKPLHISGALHGKGEYKHFMLKEIYEQPSVLGNVLHSYIDFPTKRIRFPKGLETLLDQEFTKINIIACGTSYYSGLIGKYWIEKCCRIPVEVDIASEFRYRTPPLSSKHLCIFISQSGETADTLAALRYAKSNGVQTLTLVNTPESSMEREADYVLHLHAGPEVGVASTKAFICQIALLQCFAFYLIQNKHIEELAPQEFIQNLLKAPEAIQNVLEMNSDIQKIAQNLQNSTNLIYVGRGQEVPLALEGALKIKELSYIHAEAYPFGELKHGPIALIDNQIISIILAPSTTLFEKNLSNIQEILARNGKIIVLTDMPQKFIHHPQCLACLPLPKVDPVILPYVYTVPLQLLAYHTAVLKGSDVDQPRNLAKSVTVE